MIHLDIAPQTNKELQNFATILHYWQWFRERCIRFYGVWTLPEIFGEQDGAIQEHQWVDPEEDWTAPPPEYNYDWRTQEMTWIHRAYQISFTRNEDTYGNYIRFEIKSPTEGEAQIFVKLRVSRSGRGEAIIQDTAERATLWEQEIRALTEV